MPSLFTHYLCGCKALDKLNGGEPENLISQYRQAFNLGTQGPDILFYHHVWPWTKSQGVDRIGGRIHEEKVRTVFSTMLSYILSRSGSGKNSLAAYLYGYACHYALDSNTHPYIFYKTGFVRQGETPTNKYSAYHRMFETTVDVLMLDLVLNLKPTDISAHKLIKVDKDTAQTIGNMYEHVLQSVYGIEISADQVQRSISDMVAAQAVLKDRTGIKKNLLAWFEDRMGIYRLLSSMIHPSGINDSLDYLNLKHSPWSPPWDESVKYTSSFTEMFDLAVQEASELFNSIHLCLSGSSDIEKTLDRIGNRSFETGVDCDLDIRFKYYDCIYEQGK